MKSKILKHPEWKKSLRTVTTDKGKTIIAPHWMAQGLIGMAVECTGLAAEFEHSYTTGMMHAMNAITAGMSPIDSLNYGIAAFRNENDIKGDFKPLKAENVIFQRNEDDA